MPVCGVAAAPPCWLEDGAAARLRGRLPLNTKVVSRRTEIPMSQDLPSKAKRVRWRPGLVVTIPLKDGSWGIGQTGDLMMPNVGYVALFNERLNSLASVVPILTRRALISLLAVTRHSVSTGRWHVIDEGHPLVPKTEFPNEQFAATGYVGAKLYDSELVEDFLDAYYGLAPWNGDFLEEDYLDRFLLPGRPRPQTAILLSPVERAEYRHRRGLPQ